MKDAGLENNCIPAGNTLCGFIIHCGDLDGEIEKGTDASCEEIN